MFNLKTALKGAAAGFVISFIAGIIGRVDFLIILLRAFLSAVFSAALFGGLGVLYNIFLGGAASDGEFSRTASKPSPAGSVVDITLVDDELPDSDTAPDFALSPGTRIFDTPSAASQSQGISESASAESIRVDVSVPEERAAQAAQTFSPISLGAAESASFSETAVFNVSETSALEKDVSPRMDKPKKSEAALDTTDHYVPEKKASTDDAEIGEDVQTMGDSAENISNAEDDDTLIDALPDMDGFSPDEEYYEDDDNDGTFSAVTPRSSASRTSGGDNPVDISDAKNIADAIRTALKKES